MKIVITDFPDEIKGRDTEYERRLFQRELGEDARVEVYAYRDQEELIRYLQDADGVLTAYIPFDRELLSRCRRLKAISINATGYNFIDLEETVRRDVAVCAIGEYCTREVADHTMAMLLALSRRLKDYQRDVEVRREWRCYFIPPPDRLEGQTLGIIGLGKIGKAVARRAAAFGLRILANDPLLTPETAAEYGVTIADVDTILEQSDIISNHMDANETNTGYFDRSKFSKMKKKPIFLNLSRGICMVEKDLVEALDRGDVSAAGLDVLEAESPDLQNCPLLGRDNVLITPHSAFYSKQAFRDLQDVSCMNLVRCLTGRRSEAFRVVNGLV